MANLAEVYKFPEPPCKEVNQHEHKPGDYVKADIEDGYDSPYGLTASIWTKDIGIAEQIGNKVQTGTFLK